MLFSNAIIDLQRLMSKLQVYCSKLGLTVNIDKTKAMLFRGGDVLKEQKNISTMAG